ncbi:MAG: molybdopterin-dependent oxidoreductase [Nitrospirota bacterium]
MKKEKQEDGKEDNTKGISRRGFLTIAAGTGAGVLLAGCDTNLFNFLKPKSDNPLESYPDRNWEKVYRNIYKEDSHFHFLCSPNDTHNCLLKAHVKNGVVTRISPSYRYGEATDLAGNGASHRWDPRACQKGLGLARRLYGDRRVKGAMVRKGFKDWVDRGMPRDPGTGKPPQEYFDKRGQDKWLKISWDEAFTLSAAAMNNIAETYSGDKGFDRLTQQGYDPAMIEPMKKAGTQVLKIRGGMSLLGATRIFGYYRFCNMLALLDDKIRGTGPEKSLGGRGWDSYTWHTDLPPGHPMVLGMQTNEFDLNCAEHAKMILLLGMNWITTKMPDSHWLTEARLKGTKVVNVSVEYPATGCRSDEIIVIRPGTDPALLLGVAHVIIKEKLYDANHIKKYSDLPFLVRMDTLDMLRPEDVIPGYQKKALTKDTVVMKKNDPFIGHVTEHDKQIVTEELAAEWSDCVVWDAQAKKPASVSREDFGKKFGIDPALEGTFEVTMLKGRKVKVRPVFDLMKQYINESFTPEQASKITWAPKEAIISLARDIASRPEGTLFACGMGSNQYFNADLKDRAVLFVAAMTRNIGFPGGNVGSYAGNYKVALLNGVGAYVAEDPFNIELDPAKPVHKKYYTVYESAHFYNYGDRPLRVGGHLFSGKGHLNTPTKAMIFANSNSLLGNAKWHYDVVNNTLPKIEMIAVAEYWWNGSCEYADIVYGCDYAAEFKQPDFSASCTNSFVQVHPRTPLPRVFDTKPDIEILAGLAGALGKLAKDKRFEDYWKFVREDKVSVYAQRIFDGSQGLAGFKFLDLEAKAKDGVPALMNNRTYPRLGSWEQAHEDKLWYTKSGRMEFYRPETEWIEHGENIVVYREPIDSTFHEPNVIVGRHPALRPKRPEDWGFSSKDLSAESRQVRNIQYSSEELLKTKHPLMSKGFKFIFHTPKYRHCTHTTAGDTDMVAVWFGPFGDVYRRDKRMPFVTEGYVDMNPLDAKELGIEDGDYVFIDNDPADRPYRNAKAGSPEHKTARLLCRARYYWGTPRGVTRMWYNMFGATLGSVKGHETRPDGLAKNPETNYQAMFRYGSHQSGTRAWLRPTLLTDSLVRKDPFGQKMGKGFAPDIHCANGAPREGFARITKAENGGINGKGPWEPVRSHIRPTHEDDAMKAFIRGGYIKIKKA